EAASTGMGEGRGIPTSSGAVCRASAPALTVVSRGGFDRSVGFRLKIRGAGGLAGVRGGSVGGATGAGLGAGGGRRERTGGGSGGGAGVDAVGSSVPRGGEEPLEV